MGQGCVRWYAGEPKTPFMPPPVLSLEDGRAARVDPSPITAETPAGKGAQVCNAPAMGFGPVCATVLDDRMRLASEGATFWVGVRVDAVRWVGLVGPGTFATVRPLPVDTTVEMSGHALDGEGFQLDWWLETRTKPAGPHLVLNEVMANPSGREPEQEWVELFNDGVGAVQLSDWVFQDSGGETSLPECVLGPGQFALVVNSAYDPDSWVDRPPAPGTRILRVEKLGTDGLSNAGEGLRILGKGADAVSAIPPIPSPKQGASIARRAMDLPDSLLGSFKTGPHGGTPGAANPD
jgi:hypothetical protein